MRSGDASHAVKRHPCGVELKRAHISSPHPGRSPGNEDGVFANMRHPGWSPGNEDGVFASMKHPGRSPGYDDDVFTNT